MKAIEMNQALMEAIKTTEVLGASALEETRALRQLVASANARIEELEVKAVEDAKARAMEQNGEEKGKFLFDGHHYELRQSAAITKALKAIKDAFPETHPNIEADSVDYTVVCVD